MQSLSTLSKYIQFFNISKMVFCFEQVTLKVSENLMQLVELFRYFVMKFQMLKNECQDVWWLFYSACNVCRLTPTIECRRDYQTKRSLLLWAECTTHGGCTQNDLCNYSLRKALINLYWCLFKHTRRKLLSSYQQKLAVALALYCGKEAVISSWHHLVEASSCVFK